MIPTLSLERIRNHFTGIQWHNFRNLNISNIHFDSRKIEPGGLYVSVCGCHFGQTRDLQREARYMKDAIARGAKAIITEKIPVEITKQVLGITENARLTLSQLMALLFHNPAEKLNMVGVTGTNGKTTTSYYLRSIWNAAEKTSGLMGTIAYEYNGREIPASLTTPDPVTLHNYMAQMVEDGVTDLVMEVSSHALAQHRTDGIEFNTAILTNMSHEHLDYHKTFESYRNTKAKLFHSLSSQGTAVINACDPVANYFSSQTLAGKLFYGVESREGWAKADIRAINIRILDQKYIFDLDTPMGSTEIICSLPGEHNIENCLAAAACALSEGISLDKIKTGIERLTQIPGRMESIEEGQEFRVIVDFAHTADALEKVLLSLRQVSPHRLLLVFGCGGNRDQEKRAQMGRVANEKSDFCWITNDNPRQENPRDIAEKIASAFSSKQKYSLCLDREEAIEKAIREAQPGDTVLIAGKGHETGQIIGDITKPFDDREVARTSLKKKRQARLSPLGKV